MEQTWTLSREQRATVAARSEKKPSTAGRLMEEGSERKREAERAAFAMASSGLAMVFERADGEGG